MESGGMAVNDFLKCVSLYISSIVIVLMSSSLQYLLVHLNRVCAYIYNNENNIVIYNK